MAQTTSSRGAENVKNPENQAIYAIRVRVGPVLHRQMNDHYR